MSGLLWQQESTMERKYLYAILIAFIGGFSAGAVRIAMLGHVQPTISRLTPIGKNGFEAFDSVTGRECVAASVQEVEERLKHEKGFAATGDLSPDSERVKQWFNDHPEDEFRAWSESKSGYHGEPYCSTL